MSRYGGWGTKGATGVLGTLALGSYFAASRRSSEFIKKLNPNFISRGNLCRVVMCSADGVFQFIKRAIFTCVHIKRWSNDAIKYS